MINVSTSLSASHENLVSASNDSKTMTDKSALDGCFPTFIPCSSNALNSFTFSFCIESNGAAYTAFPPSSIVLSAGRTPKTVFPLAVGIQII